MFTPNGDTRQQPAENSEGILLPSAQSKSESVAEQNLSGRSYHNKTVYERLREWSVRDGERAFSIFYGTVSVFVCLTLFAVLLFTVSHLPPFGSPENPSNNEVPLKYLEEGVRDTGAVNVVAGMILDYRAFDTFGEACVLFVAVCAIFVLLRNDGQSDTFDTLLREMEEPRPNIILQTTAAVLVLTIMVFSCYVIANGHLSPGGGFSGGAILGASFILYASAYGTKRAQSFINYANYCRVVSACLLFYALSKGYAFYTGANGIASGIPKGTPGNLFSGGLILPLNIAVGLIVAFSTYVIYILFSTGELK